MTFELIAQTELEKRLDQVAELERKNENQTQEP